MKKIITGIVFLISGILMYLTSSLIVSTNIQNTTEWNTSMGRYWQTVSNLGLFPMIILGLIFIAAGTIFALWGTFSKTDK